MAIVAHMSTATIHTGFPEFTAGDRLRLVRRKLLEVSQGELADRLDVSRQSLSAWEAGRNEAGITPAVARRLEMLTGQSGIAAFVLGVLPIGPIDGSGLPRLDSNQKPPGLRSVRFAPLFAGSLKDVA